MSGAEVAIIASNTPHNRFDSINRGISIPAVNVVDAVASRCRNPGITELLILGTAPSRILQSSQRLLRNMRSRMGAGGHKKSGKGRRNYW